MTTYKLCDKCGQPIKPGRTQAERIRSCPRVSSRPIKEGGRESREAMNDKELEHLAFSILHGTFERVSPGGCSCELCQKLLATIDRLCKEVSAKFYNEHYPPLGGVL